MPTKKHLSKCGTEEFGCGFWSIEPLSTFSAMKDGFTWRWA